jgi:hypothetical protein
MRCTSAGCSPCCLSHAPSLWPGPSAPESFHPSLPRPTRAAILLTRFIISVLRHLFAHATRNCLRTSAFV